MKIGILTFHRSINYGAFMQAYALSNRIQRDFPNDKVEIIDYNTQSSLDNYELSVWKYIFKGNNGSALLKAKTSISRFIGLLKNPRKVKHLKQRNQQFLFSQENYLMLSEGKKVSNDIHELELWLNNSNYDIIVVGSDCVWEWYQFGFPGPYFLTNNVKCKKMSYAASSDRIYYGDLDEEKVLYLKLCMDEYKYIGVRDISTQKLVETVMCAKAWNHNCDPTVLLDMNSLYDIALKSVQHKLLKMGVDVSKPIIGVMANNDLARFCKKMFGNEYQIVSLYMPYSFFKYNLIDITVLEWAVVFSLFSLTITNFFHGTLLSLKNGIPTLTFDFWYSIAEDHPTKLFDLYHRLNLKQKHYYTWKKFFSEKELEEIYSNGIKFINEPDVEDIRLALEHEAKSYDSFRDELEKCLNRE